MSTQEERDALQGSRWRSIDSDERLGRMIRQHAEKVAAMAPAANWYADHRNLALLARHMIEEGDAAADVLYMLEKPWKYEAEYQGALALNDVALIVDTQ